MKDVYTKVVATLGPATDTEELLGELLDAGVDVCRLNFSHGTHEAHARNLERVRRLSAQRNRPVAVLGDLCGPKIRLNQVRDGQFRLERGARISVVRGDDDCDVTRLTITYPQLIDEVEVGQRLLIDDGLIRLLVVEKDADALQCVCTVGGAISSRKGVNLPDTRLSTPALTDKDRRDLDWAIEHQLDYVALSFVRTPDDLRKLRTLIKERGANLHTIVKIEKVEALEFLDEFVGMADGVMVARGDLGVEMDVWRVPLVQKAITARCREAGKPVIIATQMLQSMVSNPTPTRAEVSDVANAILDGADAVMLSGETAAGDFPVESVEMMGQVALTTEAFRHSEHYEAPPRVVSIQNPITSAITNGAAEVALTIGAKLVAVWSTTGESVRLIARGRLPMPVIGLTHDERVYFRMNLHYGVTPIRVSPVSNPAEMAETLDRELIARGMAHSNDLIVVVTSTTPTVPGRTDTVLVHRVVAR